MLKVVKSNIGHKTITTNLEVYNSVSQVVQDCKTRKQTDSRFHDVKEMIEDRPEWCGVKSYDEALELLNGGYNVKFDNLKKKKINAVQGQGKRIFFRNNIVGYAPIVPLALRGVPESMQDMIMKPIKVKVLDVYYDATFIAGTSSKEIIDVGEKILRTIINLEMQGYRINLYACQTYNDTDSNVIDMLLVKLKSSNQPLDMKRQAFPLTHTAFFRVIGFDWISKTPNGRYRYGYGCPLSKVLNEEERKEWATLLFNNNAIYLLGSDILEVGDKQIEEEIKSGSNKHK